MLGWFEHTIVRPWPDARLYSQEMVMKKMGKKTKCPVFDMHPICCVYTGSHVLGLILFVVHNRSGLQE